MKDASELLKEQLQVQTLEEFMNDGSDDDDAADGGSPDDAERGEE